MYRNLLLLDPDPDSGAQITRLLSTPDSRLKHFQNGLDALEAVREQMPDLMLLDLQLADMTAADFIFRLEELRLCPPFAILSRHGQVDHAVAWVKRGALDVIVHGGNLDATLLSRVQQLLATAQSSRQIQAAEKIRQVELAHKNLMLDKLPALLLLYNQNGELLASNRSAERRGLRAGEMDERSTGASIWQVPAQLLEGRETTVRREQEWDGLLYLATWSGNGSTFLCMAEELGPRRREERERRELERSRILSQKMEALGQVAGHLGHDVSNQLLVIMGYTDMLRENLNEDPDAAKWVEAIRQAAESVGNQVRSLLAFTRGRKHAYTKVDAHSLLSVVAADIRKDYPLLRITLHSEDDKVQLSGDEQMLSEAFEAVLRNGAEAMNGEGLLQITTQQLQPELGESIASETSRTGKATHLQILIEDEGPGMQEDVLERIFDPFFTTRKSQGSSGLGLAMAWGCIRSHNGRISAKSRPGAGSSFHILLPLVTGPMDSLEMRSSVKGHVLLVDDDEVVRGVVRTILRSMGCTVSSFANGSMALDWFEQAHEPVDLALLDLRMPGMNGWELLKRLRGQDPMLRALIMTAWADNYPQDPETTRAVLGILHKPFELDDLYAHISSALSAVKEQRKGKSTN